MNIIYADSVSVALSEALFKLADASATRETSRNGNVLVLNEPVLTHYTMPTRRVLNSPLRDANPFFHLMESLWMLTGRHDLAFPQKFNARFAEYSDDGRRIWGAYGWRWRRFFGYDQVKFIINELKRNPTSRRCVLSMWNAADLLDPDCDDGGRLSVEGAPSRSDSDLIVGAEGGKDVPCNTHAYFDVRGGVLNMTVCCRSNDAIWGAYGANAVHFSILLEYMAFMIGVPVGTYRQFSNNMHVYEDVLWKMTGVGRQDTHARLYQLAMDVATNDPYAAEFQGANYPSRLFDEYDTNGDMWHYDLDRFMRGDGIFNQHGWKSSFFGGTARNMYLAWDAHKRGDYKEALEHVARIEAQDWKLTCTDWIKRRAAKREGEVK